MPTSDMRVNLHLSPVAVSFPPKLFSLRPDEKLRIDLVGSSSVTDRPSSNNGVCPSSSLDSAPAHIISHGSSFSLRSNEVNANTIRINGYLLMSYTHTLKNDDIVEFGAATFTGYEVDYDEDGDPEYTDFYDFRPDCSFRVSIAYPPHFNRDRAWTDVFAEPALYIPPAPPPSSSPSTPAASSYSPTPAHDSSSLITNQPPDHGTTTTTSSCSSAPNSSSPTPCLSPPPATPYGDLVRNLRASASNIALNAPASPRSHSSSAASRSTSPVSRSTPPFPSPSVLSPCESPSSSPAPFQPDVSTPASQLQYSCVHACAVETLPVVRSDSRSPRHSAVISAELAVARILSAWVAARTSLLRKRSTISSVQRALESVQAGLFDASARKHADNCSAARAPLAPIRDSGRNIGATVHPRWQQALDGRPSGLSTLASTDLQSRDPSAFPCMTMVPSWWSCALGTATPTLLTHSAVLKELRELSQRLSHLVSLQHPFSMP
ncbi:hypothetical protein CF319_g8895 [Tilletia indica]|uniref:Uncharacterized protein n=1 Tax=Tilletia indica TaxID=43049 RepID=A0A177T0D3_9BASI|nr:hypothetical protein CF319_g8895 [Tilletia indica]KAE8237822.1 hypothetical protein A4X13_0g8628 [Tilletia indica]